VVPWGRPRRRQARDRPRGGGRGDVRQRGVSERERSHEDIDFTGSFCHPESDAYRLYVDLYTRTAFSRSGDPNIGPRLPGLLAGAGCEDISFTVAQPAGCKAAGYEGDVKLVAPLTPEGIADATVSEGLESRGEIVATVEEL